mgnify:CR=1 FL=1
MNKTRNKSKLLALTIAMVLILIVSAMLVACNETGSQGAMKVITFDFNDGTGNTFEKVLNIEESISYTPPTREGYDFVGWTFDKAGANAFDASKVETASFTLYAQWKIKTYAVYFFLYEGEDPISTQTVNWGESALAPSEETIAQNLKVGDVFVKWANDFGNVKSDIYVYAEVSKIECSVKFVDGENVIKTAKGTFGDKITLPSDNENPTKNGYEFAGWFDEKDNQATAETTFSGDKTYYAKWTIDAPQQPTLSKDFEITYGEKANLTASISEKIEGITYTYEWFENGVSIAKGESVSIDKLGAGEHVIRCSVTASDGTQTSDAKSAFLTVTVKKATLSATIATINLVYGDNLPVLSVQYTGFKYDDDKNAIDTTNLQWDTAYTQASGVGEYTISASGFESDKYDVNFVQSKIVVGKKDVTAKSAFVFDKEYDGSTLSKTYGNESFEGVLNGNVLELVLKTAASGVGEYSLADNTITSTLSIVDGEGKNVTANYNVTFTATASISLATIGDDDYTVPTSEENTFTFDNQNHGEVVKSDNFDVTYSLEQEGEYTATQPHFTDAGVYTVYYKVSRDNYKSVSGSYVVKINKAKLDITIKNQETVYGETFSLDKTLYSVSGNDYNILSYTLACAYEVGNNAGKYPIELTIGSKSETRSDATQNFEITMNSATLTVNKAELSVVVNPTFVMYGEEFTLDVNDLTVSGLYKADDIANIVTLTTDYAADNSHVVGGEYYVYCALKSENGNYTLADGSTLKAQVTVNRREITVIVNDINVIYGEAISGYTFSVADDAIVKGDDVNKVVVCQSDYVSEHGKHTPVGSDITITATSGNANYTVRSIDGAVTVAKRPVTVNLKLDRELQYGTTFAEINSVSFIQINCTSKIQAANGDSVTRYSQYTNYDLVRYDNPDESYYEGMIGSFKLVAEVLDENLKNNYDVTITSDEIEVVAAYYKLGISKKFAYKEGEYVSFDISEAMQNVLCYGDQVKGTIKLKKNAIGKYTFVNNYDENAFNELFEMTGFKVTNNDGDDVTTYYLPSYIEFDIKIEIAQISIAHTVASQPKFTYDGDYHSVYIEGTDSDVTIEYSLDKETWTTDAPKFINVLRNTANNMVMAYTVYYKLTQYVEGVEEPVVLEDSYQVQIEPRKITIKATEQTATYGEELALDQSQYTHDGIIIKNENVDDSADLKVTISSNNYTVGKDVGNYNLNISAQINDNYQIETTNGTLKVVAKELKLIITDTDYKVTYGDEVGAFDKYSVVDNNENNYDEVKQYITLIPQYKVGNGVGRYAVKATCSNKNYTLDTTYLELTVVQRPITVKTVDASFVYGQAIAYAYEIVEGSIYGDDKLNVTYDTYNQAVKAVGKYDIMPRLDVNDGVNANYEISTQKGVVTITKATLTVSLSGTQTITYGDDMPDYTFSYTGFAYDETRDSFEFVEAYSCDYNSAKRAGTFDVTIGTIVLNNYDVKYENSKLIVNKAVLNLDAVAHEAITYGDDVPTDFASEVSGFVNGDDKSLLEGKVTYTTNYTKGADANSTKYTFNVNCEELENYNVIYGNAQTLVVNKANYTKDQVDAALAKVNLTGTYEYGKTLAAYSLMGTGFEWADANKLVTCDKNDEGYSANYCKDKTNYNAYTGVIIKIALAKADAQFHYDGEFGARWTGSAIDYAGIIVGTATPEGVSVASLVRDVQGWDPTFSYTLVAPTDKTQMIDGGIYTVRVSASETTNYNATYADVTFNVYAAQLDSEYLTVESALAKATSGKTVYLVGNAFVSKSVTVSSGVTLVLPSDKDSSTTPGSPTYARKRTYSGTIFNKTYENYVESEHGKQAYVDNNSTYIKATLTIYQLTNDKENVVITVYGNVIIQGLIGAAGGILEGHTSGSHSQIINNGKIIFKGSAKLDARGYIKGNGTIEYESGTHVYSPFVVRDFRGGTDTVTVFRKGNVSPFTQFEMPNIQCTQYYYSGSTHTGYVDLYASDDHNTDQKDFIGSNGIINVKSGYLKKEYNGGRTALTFVGETTLNALSLEVQGVTVSMSEVLFPIGWNYDIIIGTGADGDNSSLTTSYDYKIMTGASVTVNKNATLTTSGSIIIYSTFTDTAFGGAIYPNKDAAKFVVNGTYNINGSFGGRIQSETSGAKIVVSSSATLSVNSQEGNSGATKASSALFGGGTFEKVHDLTEYARFDVGTPTTTTAAKSYKSGDNTVNYTQYTVVVTGDNLLAKGTTYTYNGTSWA